MSEEGYLDYIMPQIYWGFEHKTSSGSPAPFAFENNLKSWLEMKKKGNVKLYLGLAMYKTGSNASDNNEVPEWLRYDDIMKRQVLAGRPRGRYPASASMPTAPSRRRRVRRKWRIFFRYFVRE